MSRLYPLEGLLLNLKQEIAPGRREYLPREQAYELLKEWTGQDFGYDIEAWEAWIEKNEEKE
jgi:hypothetical protein